MAIPRRPLSEILPPLILGTATFNTQYHVDPLQMPYGDIVRRALEHGVSAFDTSPYYGPSEVLLGNALRALTPPPSREGYMLITKAGRIAPREFDYSPAWIRYSVCRSLDRLSTPYLDLVYAHDVEFVSPAEVLAAIQELRLMRDQGLVRYVGISGYPVHLLATLAEMIREKTGEPLDAVLSYGHFCIQNSLLGQPSLIDRFGKAGVDCLLNASMLNMGLLTTRGVDNGPMAPWHPAPPALRQSCHGLAAVAERAGERLEEVAIRWALENWAVAGAPLGTTMFPSVLLSGLGLEREKLPARVGTSLMGVASVQELEETCRLWATVVSGLAGGNDEQMGQKSDKVARLVRDELWPLLGSWKDFEWESGGEAFVNTRQAKGVVPRDEVSERWKLGMQSTAESSRI